MTTPAPWRICSASVVGTDHIRQHIGNQDAFAVARLAATTVIAVADGGGSQPLAAVGAAAVCELAIAHVESALKRLGRSQPDGAAWTGLLRSVADGVVEAFGRTAGDVARAITRGPASDLSTTLTLVILRAPWVATALIGDGFVVTRAGADHLDLFAPPDPDPGEVPLDRRDAELTTFVTSAHAARRVRIAVGCIPDLTGVAVSTDGLTQLALGHERAVASHPYDPFLLPIFAQADQAPYDDGSLVRLLASPRITTLTGDDKTLVVAVAP
jgi:hypothetical protein